MYLRVSCGEKPPELINTRCDGRNRATHIRNPVQPWLKTYAAAERRTTRHEPADGLRLCIGEGVSRNRCERGREGERQHEGGRERVNERVREGEEGVFLQSPGRTHRRRNAPNSPRGSLSLPLSFFFLLDTRRCIGIYTCRLFAKTDATSLSTDRMLDLGITQRLAFFFFLAPRIFLRRDACSPSLDKADTRSAVNATAKRQAAACAEETKKLPRRRRSVWNGNRGERGERPLARATDGERETPPKSNSASRNLLASCTTFFLPSTTLRNMLLRYIILRTTSAIKFN